MPRTRRVKNFEVTPDGAGQVQKECREGIGRTVNRRAIARYRCSRTLEREFTTHAALVLDLKEEVAVLAYLLAYFESVVAVSLRDDSRADIGSLSAIPG